MADQDQILAEKFTQGDKDAFEQVFRLYYPSMCSYALRYMPDRTTAEEVVQELFCKLWERRDKLAINTSLKNYLYRATYNHVLNDLRHREMIQRYIKVMSSQAEEFSADSPEHSGKELEKQIALAVASLPEKRREIFEMSRYDGLKYQEIADILQIKVKTVESQMVKALEHLRKCLKDYL